MQIRIEGTDLPGRSCGPSPERPEGHHNIHVGVQRRNRPDELLGLAAGDSPSASWSFECTAAPTAHGYDIKGPYIQGPPGGRFIYLSWGTVEGDGSFRMFRRAKLRLDAVPASEVERALTLGQLVCTLGLTDERGNPRCAAVGESEIRWAAAPA